MISQYFHCILRRVGWSIHKRFITTSTSRRSIQKGCSDLDGRIQPPHEVDIKMINFTVFHISSVFFGISITAAATATRSSSWWRRRRGWSGGGRNPQPRPRGRATEKRRLYSTPHSQTEIIRQDHYVDVEIGRSERVAVCGGEVTGVVGDVDVAVIADLPWKAPFQKS